MDSKSLAQIHPKAFAHPYDEAAADALRKVPFLPAILSKVSEVRIEERYRAYHMYNSICLGPRQLPSIWRMVNDVAERFGIACPTTYVSRGGQPNAFAFGLQNHSIVLTTELVDMVTDDELEAIIAHEIGHILCEHMLYRNVGLALTAQGTAPLAKIAPDVVASSLNLVFMAWSRSAEYSADRAALLVLRDPEVFASCLSKLAGVPRRFFGEFDPRQFAEQIDVYQREAEENSWSRFVTWDIGLLDSHPEPTKRAAALLEWAVSDQYREIIAGNYLTRAQVERENQIVIKGIASCELCGHPVGQLPICPNCQLPQNAAAQVRCKNDHLASSRWQHCRECGAELTTEGIS